MKKQSLSTGIAVALILFTTLSSYALDKKNVCTVTLNSDEESLLFKKHFSATEWNFIELTHNALNERDNYWFQRSCEQNIKCDVLIVSGHFGGSFFGKSPFRLSVEDLETFSCNSKCDGIIHNPKEVFLFGCNTLASKDKDRRSPQEYMQVLLADGFSQTQASQIVSFRYSGFSDSFKSKMTQIFAKSPRIYGFTSIGPSGKTVEPYLNRYLESTASEYSNFDKYISEQSTKPNSKLLDALKKTSIDQTFGGLLNMKYAEEKPYCYIRSQKVTNLEKIKYIDTLLSSGDGIKLLSHIQNFIHSLRNDSIRLSLPEQQALNNIRQNEKIKSDLINLLNLQGDVYIPLKANIVSALVDLNFITQSQAVSAMNKILELNHPFDDAKQSYLCNANLKVDITADMIPKERLLESPFINVLSCLTPEDPKISDLLISNLAPNQPDNLLKANTVHALQRLQTRSENHYLAIAKVLETPNIPVYLKFTISYVLSIYKPKNPEIRRLIANAMRGESNQTVIIHLARALSN